MAHSIELRARVHRRARISRRGSLHRFPFILSLTLIALEGSDTDRLLKDGGRFE